jgi:hypothetical protein
MCDFGEAGFEAYCIEAGLGAENEAGHQTVSVVLQTHQNGHLRDEQTQGPEESIHAEQPASGLQEPMPFASQPILKQMEAGSSHSTVVPESSA